MKLIITIETETEKAQFKEEELEQISDELYLKLHVVDIHVKNINFKSDEITTVPAPLYPCTQCGAMVRHVHNPTGLRADSRRLCPDCWRAWERSSEAAEIAAMGSGSDWIHDK
jgi:hypothetical protein